jgi:HlyD family secretion protein
MGGAVVAWAAFWLVPTEVVGKGVLLLPDNAGMLDARAAGRCAACRSGWAIGCNGARC